MPSIRQAVRTATAALAAAAFAYAASSTGVAQTFTLGGPRAGYGGIAGGNPFIWAGAREQRAEADAMNMLQSEDPQQEANAEKEAYTGMLDGSYAPSVRFTPGSTDIAAMLAKKFVAGGYRKMTVSQATNYLNERQADYERDVSAAGLPANSMTSACGYWVESLYLVGGGVRVASPERDQVLATCALEIGKTEKLRTLNNEQRYAIGRSLAIIGATFRHLADDPGQHADAVNGARAMFKSNFGYALDAVPVSRFPCVLSDAKMSDCDTIMSRYAARLPEIARRNT